jgi:hypothetical protein
MPVVGNSDEREYDADDTSELYTTDWYRDECNIWLIGERFV